MASVTHFRIIKKSTKIYSQKGHKKVTKSMKIYEKAQQKGQSAQGYKFFNE